MNAAIVKNWNNVVINEDDVYVLGDLMLNDNETGLKLIKSLNGRIHVVLGNHDTDNRIELYHTCPNIVEVENAIRLNKNGYHLFMTHYPCLCANYDDGRSLKKQCISLCGHSHYKNPFQDMDKGLIYHCELDCHKNMPIEVNKIIEELTWFSTLSIEQKNKISSMEVYNEKNRYDGMDNV